MIRWDEPIEAYHTDGRVCSARRIDDETVWWTDGHMWHSNRIDGTTGFDGWRIRNVTTPTPPNTPAGYSDEVVERLAALVRRMAPINHVWQRQDYDEARAIVALIEPVDADETAANEVCRAIGFTSLDEASDVRKVALAAIRRGRALAAEGR